VCSNKCTRKNPISTNSSACSPESRTDSGITSTNATASMYPAPRARKYCRYCRGHSFRTTKYPPSKFPTAATSPSSAARVVRSAASCSILGDQRSENGDQQEATRRLRVTHAESALGSFFIRSLFFALRSLFFFFIRNAGTGSRRLLARRIPFPRAALELSLWLRRCFLRRPNRPSARLRRE